MENELIESESQLPATVPPEASEVMAIITKAAENPDFDANKLEKLINLHLKMEDRQRESEFGDAMSIVQADCKGVKKDSQNKQTSSWYASMESIDRVLRPSLSRNGISFTCGEGESNKPGHVRVVAEVRRGGFSKEYFRDVPLDSKGIKGNVNKTETHGNASAFTYGERYLKCSIFNISTGDDNDGNGAGAPPAELLTEEQVLSIDEKLGYIEEAFGGNTAISWRKRMIAAHGEEGSGKLATIPQRSFEGIMEKLHRKLTESVE